MLTEEQIKALEEKAAKVDDLESKARASEDFKKDMLKFKDEHSKAQTELEQIKKVQAEAEAKRLTEGKEFETLYTREKEAREKAEQEKAESLQKVDRFVKKAALETHLKSLGLRPEALIDLRRLDFDGLVIKNDGGEIQVEGVETFSTDLKKTRPHWFGESKDVNFNGGGGEGMKGQTLSGLDLAKLQKEKPLEYKAAIEKIMADSIKK